MADTRGDDRESDTTPGASQGAPKGTQFLKKGYKDLEEAELATPVAVRFLLEDRDRLSAEVAGLIPFRDRCYNLDIRVAILEEKTKVTLAFEILSSAALAIGAALIGYARYLWDTSPTGYFALGIGLALTIGAFVAKAVKR